MPELQAERVWALDEIEASAWRDLLDAAPPALGVRWARIAGATVLMAPRISSPLWNRAIGVGNGEPATDAVIDEVIVRLTAAGVADPWIQLSLWARPQAIGQWLGTRGFAPALRGTWVVLARGRDPEPEMATALEIRELAIADAPALARVVCEAHGVPALVAPAIEALVGRRGWRAYGAFDGGALVAGGLLRCDGRDAWLGLGGTLASHRARGAYHALIARRIADAIAQGATTIASAVGAPDHDSVPSAPLASLLRCGFRVAAARTSWCLVR